MRKVFISYRHRAHIDYKISLQDINKEYNLFVDKSVNSRDISNQLKDETIRQRIRDEKLKDSTITILLHGVDTDKRMFIDWELAGSMIDYNDSYRNAIIILDLTNNYAFSAGNTKENDVSNTTNTFRSITNDQKKSPSYWKRNLPYAPKRITQNLVRDDVFINIMKWDTFTKNPKKLKRLIDIVYENRKSNNYDTSEPLAMKNG